ncbi:MAG TPA: ABC transporter substrate-binding protein [Candidatus Egerieimonas intestinavium]|uniref:ABC transporter substrate-binding protein n=1 Tax=Candidatus Egerieimonas intestinavium TaxID=2840777 RepID=A0A9D1ELU1_9FIRM|nr:ABC transporter substrate-binding protein [Candidatus Egerieimonas intestinavium]
MGKKWICTVLAAGLMISALVGCGNKASGEKQEGTSQTAAGEKVFVFGDTTFNAENGEPDINPHNDNSGWACIRYGVGETLFRFSDTMEIEPWLAESYENVDELTWKINLRDDVNFTSGRHMDGEAVKECLEALVTDHARAAENLHIAEITAEGQTVTIRTEEPVAALINYLADPYGCIFDVQAGVTEEGIVSATGPYKAVSLVTDTQLELVKNEDYWNGEPKLDKITVRTISDGDTLTMALQSGEINAAYGMPYASYPLFENDKYTFTSTPTSRVFFGAMNYESKITSDPAVRKAIAMGIDKEGFVETLLNGNGYAAVGVYPDNFSFGGDVVTTESYDPEGAKKVLEEAGWVDSDGDGIREKDGKKLTLRWLTYPSRQEQPLLAEAAQATLGDIGFAVEVNNTADHNSIRVDSSAWDIYVSALVTAPTGDPEYFFTLRCLDSSSNNDGHYHNDQLEELAAQMKLTFDKEKREELGIQMQQIILDDNAFVFCSHLRMSMIAQSTVTGLVAHPCDYYEITVDLDMA